MTPRKQLKLGALFMADHLALLNMPLEALKRSHTATSGSRSGAVAK